MIFSELNKYGIARGSLIAIVGLLSLSGCAAEVPAAHEIAPGFDQHPRVQQFSSIYEPSGVLTLPGGDILVIEDEARQAMSILSFDETGNAVRTPVPRLRKHSAGYAEDLEGVASDDAGHVFAITSHSRTRRNRLPAARRKLVRYRLNDGEIREAAAVSGLRQDILRKYPDIKDRVSRKRFDLNIEALGYHRQDRSLMLGLRTPVIDDQAVIVSIQNPDQMFSEQGDVMLGDRLIMLDLDKGGIRAISYDEILGGYLILSRREDKRGKPFKLWLWSGEADDKPKRILFEVSLNLDFAEGVTPIKTETMAGILLVFDDGNRRKTKGADYILLPYEHLRIDQG